VVAKFVDTAGAALSRSFPVREALVCAALSNKEAVQKQQFLPWYRLKSDRVCCWMRGNMTAE
jgi:hypothetical protein